MARPRKDAAGPSAEQRIHQAFWELIAEMPLERITVGTLRLVPAATAAPSTIIMTTSMRCSTR